MYGVLWLALFIKMKHSEQLTLLKDYIRQINIVSALLEHDIHDCHTS